jgi:sugar (pentulose or hexulose) kinase
MKFILALDAGTTSLKVSLFNFSGVMVGGCVQEYRLDNPSPEIVELEPEVYWSAAQDAIVHILSETSILPADIAAVGVTSQGETLIVLDKQGRPLRKAIVWLDNRAEAEAKLIREKFGRDLVYQVTGQQDILPSWPAAKILWLRTHEPEVFQAAYKFLMLEDYLIYRLTGKFATDHALNPSTLYYDLRNGCWWESMLAFIGISPQQLPTLLNSGSVAGTVVGRVGLTEGTRVTVAPMDQVAAAVGGGNIAPGVITETTGCALALCATVDHPVYDPKARIALYRHAVPGVFALLPWIPTAGMILRWFRDEFGDGMDYSALDEQAAAVPPGSDGLILLPHFGGMLSPEVNSEARGVFWGISTAHRKAHFIRSILEAVAFALRDNLELLTQTGVECRQITCLGGAARSKVWLQIKADVLQRPVRTLRCEETTSLGTAMLAAIGAGIFPNIEAAIAAMVHPAGMVSPDTKNRATYNAAFRKYKEVNRKNFVD